MFNSPIRTAISQPTKSHDRVSQMCFHHKHDHRELIVTILGTDEHCTKLAHERVNIAMYDIIRIHIT